MLSPELFTSRCSSCDSIIIFYLIHAKLKNAMFLHLLVIIGYNA